MFGFFLRWSINLLAIVIAGSGMMTGGRILHHLRAHLADSHTTVMIVGFQPAGGLGRLLVEATRVVVLGRAGHAAVAEVEEAHVVEAELRHRRAQLQLTRVPERVGRGERGVADLAHLAARGADQGDVRSLYGILCQRAAERKTFIVGMRENYQ